MNAVRDLGYSVTHDWVSIIEDRGSANPTDATVEQRKAWAKDDLAGVEAADVLWLLMPAEGGLGQFWEAGYAQALRKPIVVSGCYERTIFTAGCRCYTTDHDALIGAFR